MNLNLLSINYHKFSRALFKTISNSLRLQIRPLQPFTSSMKVFIFKFHKMVIGW